MEGRVDIYLSDAEEFLNEAIEEFNNGVKSGDQLKIRDAAEKAWNAVVQATNALIFAFMKKVPASHWERRRLLRELELANQVIAQLGFRDRYSARERNFHELVFYEGIVDINDIKVELDKVRRYINDVKNVIQVISH
ncbi:hypothetical protein VMUT_0474 [Vulcanisaeta moutnovskia 768-28]|uniref:PaREP1 domain containing protein n=1 Tax=Vulcanisaeta moutnovskia (strain 768-28) TaxID=985053 RepID=F0QUM5_VULM7|nr:PaREP1 family protein [Vulcanisaeta moutnovskia]ADY00686.1 hypothetical protein VMUT_0474 [Vulcanisaeta moutnovskia 768-28]